MRFRVPVLPVVVTLEWSPRDSGRWSLSMRDLIVLVALAALATLPWVASRRDSCRRRIAYHSWHEYAFLRKLPQYERRVEEARRVNRPADPADLRAIADYRGSANHHREQIRRYEDALTLPWRSVADPAGSGAPGEDDLTDAARRWEKVLESKGRPIVNP